MSVAEMQAADRAALQHVAESTLVQRAGTAVAREAQRLVRSPYGSRVVVVAGKGNNGADGRVAARQLSRRGARVRVVDAAEAPSMLPPCDLVIDAAFGTGFRGTYNAPEAPPGTPVVAVDIPSGVEGDSGHAPGRPMRATSTVTFAALKPGLLQGDGAAYGGSVSVADIGIDVGPARVGLVEDADVAGRVPRRPPETNKWVTALAVVAGSPGMEGAANFSARGASHAGAGMVRLGVPGSATGDGGMAPGPWPLEAVRMPLQSKGWSADVLGVLERCRALVIGPGLGRDDQTRSEVRELIARSPVPVLADADALFALGDADSAREVIAGERGVSRPVILTPHDGEYARIAGSPPGTDRIDAARALAGRCGAVVLLKGRLTAVASPSAVEGDGAPDVLLAAAGSPRLATAGTGDVLSGVIGALLARGVPALFAAALGAHLHGRAASLGHDEGLVAGDLPDLVARLLSAMLPASD